MCFELPVVFAAWKVSEYGVISSPYFPLFSPNTRKYRPEITSYVDTFHAAFILRLSLKLSRNTAQKMNFSIKNFFSKCDQIRRILRIWSHLLKKSLMENFIFCAVFSPHYQSGFQLNTGRSIFNGDKTIALSGPKIWKIVLLVINQKKYVNVF